MFFNSLFFPLFSLLFSSRTHSLSHAHTLSLLFARVVFRRLRVVHGSFITLKRKKERAAFQLLCFDLFLSETGVLLKKCRRKKVVWTLLLRGERPKLLFDFDSRLLGFISRGTFEKQKTTRSRPPQKHNTEQQQQQPQKLKRKNDFDDDNEHERCWHSQNYCEEQFHQQTKRWWFCSSRSE